MREERFKNWGAVILPVVLFLLAHRVLARMGIPSAASSCLIAPVIGYLYIAKIRRKTENPPKLTRSDGAKLAVMAVCIGLSSALVAKLAGESDQQSAVSLVEIVGFSIAGPINEELIYRGFVFGRGKQFLGTVPAIFLSAVLFGVGHLESAHMVVAMAAGILFCLMVLGYGNIKAAIFAHICVNLLSFWAGLYDLPLGIYILGVAGLAVSSFRLYDKYRKRMS